MNTTDTSIAP